MTFTRRKLESILRTLKDRKEFAFGKIENAPYDDLDVFPARDTVEPALDGEADSYLWWTPRAEQAFKGNKLLAPLPLRFGGDARSLQHALADANVAFRLDEEDDPVPGYDATYTLVISPEPYVSDLTRLNEAMKNLRRNGVAAIGHGGLTQSNGWDAVHETQRGQNQSAVFWNSQGQERSLDSFGNIGEPLMLYWRGDSLKLCLGLRKAGLKADPPAGENTAIEVSGSDSPPPQIPSYEEVLNALPSVAVTAEKRRTLKTQLDWKKFSAPFAKEVTALAFSPDGKTIVASTAFSAPLVHGNTATGLLRVCDHALSFLYPQVRWWSLEGMEPGFLGLTSMKGRHSGYSIIPIDLMERERPHPMYKQKRERFWENCYALHPDRKSFALLTDTGIEIRTRSSESTWELRDEYDVAPENPYESNAPDPQLLFEPAGRYLVWHMYNEVALIDTYGRNIASRIPIRKLVADSVFEARMQRWWITCDTAAPVVYIGMGRWDDDENDILIYEILAIDLESGKQIKDALPPETTGSTAAAFSDDGLLAAFGDKNGRVVIFDWFTKSVRFVEPVSRFKITQLVFQPGGHHLAVGDRKGRFFTCPINATQPSPENR